MSSRISSAGGVLSLVILAALPGCKEEDSGKVETLEREVTYLRGRYEAEKERLEEVEKKKDELEEENREAKRIIQELEAKLTFATMELAGRMDEPEEETEGDDEAKKEKMAKAEEAATEPEDAPAAEPAKPDPKEQRELAKKQVTKALDAFVTITGDVQSGAGMLVTADGKTWIYTAASLVAANRKLKVEQADGSPIEKFGAFELAGDGDLARLEVPAGAEVTATPAAGTEVKSGTPLFGAEYGLPADGKAAEAEGITIKVSSHLEDGGLGAPIFHGESGELIALLVAGGGAERTLWAAGTSPASSHEVAHRIDRPIEWAAISIGSFLQESRTIEAMDVMTRLAEAFLALDPGPEGMDIDVEAGPNVSVRDVFQAHKSLSVVRSAAELQEWLEERGARSSAADLKRKISSVYGDIQSKLRGQIREFAQERFSPPNESAATQSLQWAQDADRRLASVIRGLEED